MVPFIIGRMVITGIGPNQDHFRSVFAYPFWTQLETIGSIFLSVGVKVFCIMKLCPRPPWIFRIPEAYTCWIRTVGTPATPELFAFI